MAVSTGLIIPLDQWMMREAARQAHEAALGVDPAHERLEAGDAAGLERDDRLRVRAQLVRDERGAQLGLRRRAVVAGCGGAAGA